LYSPAPVSRSSNTQVSGVQDDQILQDEAAGAAGKRHVSAAGKRSPTGTAKERDVHHRAEKSCVGLSISRIASDEGV
jgi:hypothetical protein